MSSSYLRALARAAGWGKMRSADSGQVEATPRPRTRFESWPDDVGKPEWDEILAERDAPQVMPVATTTPAPASRWVAEPPDMPKEPGVTPSPVPRAMGATAEPLTTAGPLVPDAPPIAHSLRLPLHVPDAATGTVIPAASSSTPLAPMVTRGEGSPSERVLERTPRSIDAEIEARLAPRVRGASASAASEMPDDLASEALLPAAVVAIPKPSALEEVPEAIAPAPVATGFEAQPLVVEIGQLEIRLDPPPAAPTHPTGGMIRRPMPVLSLTSYLAGVTGGQDSLRTP